MNASKVESVLHAEIPGSIVHVSEEVEGCFKISAIFFAESRLEAQKKLFSIIIDRFDPIAVSFNWFGTKLFCEHNPYPEPRAVIYSNGYSDDSDDSDDSRYSDDSDDGRSPNWPSKTGNPSGGGRDNNPRSK